MRRRKSRRAEEHDKKALDLGNSQVQGFFVVQFSSARAIMAAPSAAVSSRRRGVAGPRSPDAQRQTAALDGQKGRDFLQQGAEACLAHAVQVEGSKCLSAERLSLGRMAHHAGLGASAINSGDKFHTASPPSALGLGRKSATAEKAAHPAYRSGVVKAHFSAPQPPMDRPIT